MYIIVENYYEKHDQDNVTNYSDHFFEFEDLQVVSNSSFPSASVKIRKGEEVFKSSAVGTGPIDALYSAIAEITNIQVKLIGYDISSVSRGKDALGKVKITISHEGENYVAKAADTDILKASALAYINAINSVIVAGIKETTMKTPIVSM